MYKLIAVDLDGTLLNSYSQVSEKNKQAIKNAKNKGIEVVLCSGRGFASVKSIANETEANNYAVCGNGALVYNIKNQKMSICRMKCTKMQLSENFEKSKFIKFLQILGHVL